MNGTTQTKKVKKTNASGMTLMEIMIVMLILGGATTMFVSRMGSKNNDKIKEAVRKLGVLSKDLHGKAKLQNSTFRLVIDLSDGAGEESPQRYWTESASGSVLAKKDSFSSPFTKDKKKAEEETKNKAAGGFAIVGKKNKLPSGVFFEDVEIKGIEEPIDSGKAYIHYRPEGFVDESAIHLKYTDKKTWTIAIHPLTGKATINGKYIKLKEYTE